MSSGAITLKCPHCGGVFLTLQHGGIIEICPHCAVGAPRASFTSSNESVGVRPRSDLPSARRETGAAVAAAVAPPPVLNTPFPVAPEISTSPVPLPGPMPVSPIVQAAPTVHEIVPRNAAEPAPVQNGTRSPSGETFPPPAPAPRPVTVPDAAPPSRDTPAFQSALWPPPERVNGTTESGSSAGFPVPAPVPPTWPGLDRDEGPEPTNPFPTETVQRSPDPDLEHRPLSRRGVPWFTLTMLAALIGIVTWLALQGPPTVSIPQSPQPPPAPVPPTVPAPSTKPAQGAAAAPKSTQKPAPAPTPAPTPPPKEPAPEVKAAIPNATPDEVAALRARAAEEHLAVITDKMLQALDSAPTQNDRLQWVDATEQQQSEMKRFFESHHGKLGPVQLEPSAGAVTLLPSGDQVKLFRLTTATCPDGAIVQVREDGGRAKLRWGLFEQSHEKTYDHFLASTDAGGSARWFTLLCQRAHSFELKGVTKDQWICFDAQGSLGANGTGQIYINKDSPVGRFLEPKTQWGRLYLVELLVGKMGIEGHRLNVVLDTAGLHGGTGRP